MLWLVLSVAFLASRNAAQDHLSEFLPLPAGESSEEHVQRLRDVFVQRLRCGTQQGMSKTLCEDCFSVKRILNITRRVDDGNVAVAQQVGRVSVVILNYLLSFRTSCTAESIRHGYVGSCRVYERCRSEMQTHLAPMNAENLEALEKILREVKAVFEPDPSKQCFSAEMVLNELNARSKKLDALPRDVSKVVLVLSHLYSGECIDVGESVADFLDDIFLHYGDGCERVMTQSGFTKLWNDLQMQRRGKHINHGVQKNACFSASLSASPQNYPTTGILLPKPKDATTAEDFSENITTQDSVSSLKNKSTAFATNKTTPSVLDFDSTSVVMLVPSATNLSGVETHPHNSDVYLLGDDREAGNGTVEAAATGRRVRHMPTPGDHEHKNLANECLPSVDLLQRFLTPGNQVITSSEFLQLCPALVQQAVSGVCTAQLKTVSWNSLTRNETTGVQQKVAPKSASPWFSVAAVTLITAISLLGLFLLPVLKKSFFVHINAFFTGLAFGTMSGDVVLHIMPQYLGLHKHDDSGHDHDEETTLERLFPSYLQRQLAFLFTIYLLFLVESIFCALTGEKKEHHGHSHGSVDISLRDLNAVSDIENVQMKPKLSFCLRLMEFMKPSNLFSGMSSKAAVIVLADTVHNFADGMAIAVGFSTSYKDGISTSIAVFFHELPHEIGDFAILMNCGLSYWKAFVFNLLSGLSAFIGLGVGVFTASLLREWLLCITAGLFFFVVMGEMLPDMRLESRETWREFAVKIIGTMLGITTMICIAMYELSAS